MDKFILAGVGVIKLFDNDNNLFLTSKTLTDSSISVSVTAEDIKGGLSNPVLGKYFHDSVMSLNITDALFNLQYLATNLGGNITVGGEAIYQESVTPSAANTITVTGTPQPFGEAGTIGWVSEAGKDNWQKITFVGNTATVVGVTTDKKYCVQYVKQYDAMTKFIIPAAIIPKECHAILTAPLFAAGSTTFTSSSKVGELIVDIPRYLLSGSADLSMTSSGAATTNLSGTALAYTNSTACDDDSMYATVAQNIFGATWDADLIAMAVEDADFTIAQTETKTLKVYGLFNGGMTGVINPANLTYTCNPNTIGSVAQNTGIFTASNTAGDGVIEIVDTTKEEIVAYANVTVSA